MVKLRLDKLYAMALRIFFLVGAVLAARVLGHHPLGASHKGYALGIRDSFMIAHSFKGQQFGRAQKVRSPEPHMTALAKLSFVIDASTLQDQEKYDVAHFRTHLFLLPPKIRVEVRNGPR